MILHVSVQVAKSTMIRVQNEITFCFIIRLVADHLSCRHSVRARLLMHSMLGSFARGVAVITVTLTVTVTVALTVVFVSAVIVIVVRMSFLA